MKWTVTTLVFCVGLLLALGMVMLYSASMVDKGSRLLVMQLLWAAVGLLACVIATAMDYRDLKKFSWVLLVLAVVMLALVLVPGIGRKIGGARRWFGFGPVNFQPSELAKLALIIALAHYAELRRKKMETFFGGLVIPGAFIGLVLVLIFVEPDRGTTILMAAVSGVMLLVAGVRWRFLIPPAIAVVAAFVYSIIHDPMRMRRIMSWTDLEATKEGVGYQVYQAIIALGAGGWTGLGLGNGRQKLGFVPEHHTDFIFSIIGEELGLIFTFGVVVLFLVIVLCGIRITRNARDHFGQLLAAGITFLIGFQACINIGVVTGALPNKGLPLPFISYGGSSLLMMLACVGLLLSVARQAHDDPAPVKVPRRDNLFAAPPQT